MSSKSVWIMETDVTRTVEDTRGLWKKWCKRYGMARIEEKESGWRRRQTSVAADMWESRNRGNGVTVSHRE